jgi:hypothetical protein
MKRAMAAAAFALAALAAGSSEAKTVSASIPMSAQIVAGTTVAAFVVNGAALTVVHAQSAAPQSAALPYGAPALEVGVHLQTGEVLTQRSTWDALSHLLTIDF